MKGGQGSPIVKSFNEYLEPKKNLIALKAVFNKMAQKLGQPIDQFLERLKEKADDIWTVKAEKESAILQRIVEGAADIRLRRDLLRKQDLTYETAVAMARAYEVDEANMAQLEMPEKSIDKISNKKHYDKNKNTKDLAFRCRFCGRQHERGKCPAYGQQCNGCQKKGHFKACCKEINAKSKDKNNSKCFRCNGEHEIKKCPAYNKTCEKCNKKGHLTVCCKTKNDNKTDEISNEKIENISRHYYIDGVSADGRVWYEYFQIIDTDKKVYLKIDTGGSTNILSLKTVRGLGLEDQVDFSHANEYYSYTDGKIKIIGLLKLHLRYKKNIEKMVEFEITENPKRRPLLGLADCFDLGVVPRPVDEVEKEEENTPLKLVKKYPECFTGIGHFPDEYEIKTKTEDLKIFKPARRLKPELEDKVKEELSMMEKLKIIEKVKETKPVVNSMVVVYKKDGQVRICIDPRDLNQQLVQEKFLLPTLDEVKYKLSNKKYFTVIDCKKGFWQIKLTDKSADLCTFNTPYGLYRFLRLPFGLNIGSEVYQRYMVTYFQNMKNTLIYIDDIIVYADTKEEMNENLHNLFSRAKEVGIKFNNDKIQYCQEKVKFLGFIFSKESVEIDQEKLNALDELKIPKNKNDLQKILGTINYLRDFIPNFSNITKNIRKLLKNNIEFKWEDIHKEDLNKIIETIKENTQLYTFDQTKDVTVQTDASQHGIGAVLLQDNKPIYFASRTLNSAEQNYAQIEKEMLGIVFGISKFNYYLFGKQIRIETDHKPLIPILNKDFSKIYSTRLQRMKLKIQQYNYDVHWIPGNKLILADALSRFMKKETEDENKDDYNETIHEICYKVAPNRLKNIIEETGKDEILKLVMKYVKTEWPKKTENHLLKPFFKIKNEIFLESDEFLTYNDRIIIPKSLRYLIMQKLHEPHMGLTKTLEKARQLVYWPNITVDIESFLRKCLECQKIQDNNRNIEIKTHEIVPIPFYKIGIDIGFFENKDYLILIDYYSKWIEIEFIKNKQISTIITVLEKIFATHGYPTIIISDNNPFNSYEFAEFAKENSIQLNFTAPHHHQSNGMSENAVKIAKKILEKNKNLNKALLEYRNTPIYSRKNYTPAQIMFSRRCQTDIPINPKQLFSNVVEKEEIIKQIIKHENKIKENYNKNVSKIETYNENEIVRFKMKLEDKDWKLGKIITVKDERNVIINNNGRNITRNIKFIRKYNKDNDKKTFKKRGEEMENVPLRPKRNIKKPVRYQK